MPKFKINPKTPIYGLTKLPLQKSQIINIQHPNALLKCMNGGPVYYINNENEILVTKDNYNTFFIKKIEKNNEEAINKDSIKEREKYIHNAPIQPIDTQDTKPNNYNKKKNK